MDLIPKACPAQDFWIWESSWNIYWCHSSDCRLVSSENAEELSVTGKGSLLKMIPIIHSSACFQYQGDKEAS